MKKITSVHNSIVTDVTKLKNTKERKKSALFCAEGYKLIHELISCDYEITHCFISDSADLNKLPKEIDSDKLFVVSEQILKKISSMTSPSEIIAVAKENNTSVDYSNDKCILALDCIQDPSNLGAILRSAEAFGTSTILLGEGCCDAYSAKVLRSSMGSVLRLNIICTDLKKELSELKSKEYTIIGTGLNRNFRTVDKLSEYTKKVIVIGNEGNGISEKIEAQCDFGMFIPMTGKNESLNAAVAASIILWEEQRQNNGR